MTRAAALHGLVLVLAIGCSQQTRPDGAAKPAPASGATATPTANASSPDVTLQILDLKGLEGLIESKQGKVVVLDAWSTSCEPCVKEFENLVKLQREFGDKVACISLSFDYEGIGQPADVRDRVLKFLREKGATFDNVLSSVASDDLARHLKLASVPAVFVYSRDGVLRKRFDNEDPTRHPFNYGQVTTMVDELLAEPIPPKIAELIRSE